MRGRGDALGLVVAVIAVFAVGAVGSVATAGAVSGWYAELQKPAWTPPSWVFGPVWSALYLMMAFAAWAVWRREGWPGARLPLALFAVQLVLNGAWSPVFFGARAIGPAFVLIVVLWCAILATLVLFWRVLAGAGALLVPYLAWVSYAAALNFALWRLNA